MTAIVGLVHEGKVYIGGDSAGVGGYALTVREDSKVFINGPAVFGFTTSFRMGQVLRYGFVMPPFPEKGDVERYMVVDFINKVRTVLKDSGFAGTAEGQETGGRFLVGYRSRLFMVDEDYQVAIPADGYSAVGSGDAQALGALYATPKLAPEKRIELALSAAERFNAAVRGPFHIMREP